MRGDAVTTAKNKHSSYRREAAEVKATEAKAAEAKKVMDYRSTKKQMDSYLWKPSMHKMFEVKVKDINNLQRLKAEEEDEEEISKETPVIPSQSHGQIQWTAGR